MDSEEEVGAIFRDLKRADICRLRAWLREWLFAT